MVHPIVGIYDAAHREDFFAARYDYIVDAIDLVSCKLDLIGQARQRRIPILTALGTGNKLHPELLTITDIARTSGCPLARVMRKELRARDIHHLRWCSAPSSPARHSSWRRRLRDGAASPPAYRGCPPWRAC